MNKKLLVALILPLMLIPLTSFAYAHWTDKVTKQIKLHAGTVEVHIVQWHIDKCNSYDVDCDGVIFGDELKVEVLTEDDQVVEILITADPVYPSWELEFKFLIHNKGRLAVDSAFHRVEWDGPFDEDPCWKTQPFEPRAPPDCIYYVEELFLHDGVGLPDTRYDKAHYTVPVSPTTYQLKPCECVMVKEYIHFDCQDMPEMQCKWFRLAKEMGFISKVGPDWSSEGETYPPAP